MDVRCERCKTEYEFDDARITEAGVTVKCTTCGHVFKVKKKALVVTVPVKGEEAHDAPPASSAAPQPTPSPATTSAAEKPREWKVKQSNGNVFNFKELTTLQKWIVERKVSRDDEISLTGESWKRLGNIAELASFFQVVEEAQKAAQLSAMQSGPYGAYGQQMGTPASGFPMPNVGAAAPPSPNAPTQVVQQSVVPPPPIHSPPPAQQQGQPPAIPNHNLDMTGVVPPPEPPPRKPAPDTLPFTQPAKKPAPVMSAQRRAPVDEEPDYAAAGVKKSGGAGKFLVVLLVLALLGGGGYYGYFYWWLPQEQAKQEADAAAAKKAQEDALKAKVPANTVPPAVPVVAAVVDAGVADAGAPMIVDAGHVVVDAGMPAVVDAGTPPVVKKEPVRDFDWYMTQGDKLRDREKAAQALDMYGKAADLQPDRAEPMAGRGLALLDMGQKPQAEASFQQALKANPRYGVALMGLAETYRAMGQKADAIKYYEKYLDVLPNGPEAPVAKEAVRRLKSE
ncbi:MAG: zinc-ribbon domain-containing protein [Myxococcaceae bacterium]